MPLTLVNVLAAAALTAGLGHGLAPAQAADPAGGRPSGAWGWPLAGVPVVARPFLPPTTQWGPGHRGVDLAGVPDQQVLSAGAGVVGFAGYVAGVGVVSILHPDGLRTTYEPIAPSVAAGHAVSLGDPIGRLLSGHGDCGPGHWCLHWGLLRGSTYRDPLTLVGRGPIRLLPLAGGVVAGAAGSPAGQRLRPASSPADGLRATDTAVPTSSQPRAALLAGHRRSTMAAVMSSGAAVTSGASALAWLGGQARRRRNLLRRRRHPATLRGPAAGLGG